MKKWLDSLTLDQMFDGVVGFTSGVEVPRSSITTLVGKAPKESLQASNSGLPRTTARTMKLNSSPLTPSLLRLPRNFGKMLPAPRLKYWICSLLTILKSR